MESTNNEVVNTAIREISLVEKDLIDLNHNHISNDYRGGYIEGLKRAVEILKNLKRY